MRIYEKKVDLFTFQRKLIKYANHTIQQAIQQAIQLNTNAMFWIQFFIRFSYFYVIYEKGYCHIDGKVYTINFCPGSEMVCPTFSDFKIDG